MDNKFYVIGVKNEEQGNLRCGESLLMRRKNSWELITNMSENVTVLVAQSPPLVGVVSNELYCLEARTNELMVLMKKTKTWKKLGGEERECSF